METNVDTITGNGITRATKGIKIATMVTKVTTVPKVTVTYSKVNDVTM